MFTEYEPGTYLPWISPTPLLMCVAENDVLTVKDIAIEGYAAAREPKKLVILPGGYFDAYVDGFDVAGRRRCSGSPSICLTGLGWRHDAASGQGRGHHWRELGFRASDRSRVRRRGGQGRRLRYTRTGARGRL